jgi:tetratricopeptide (TPR) repeat protein
VRQLYAQGDFQAAVRGYERLVRILPQNAELWFRLANGYVRIGQPDAAVTAYRNALLRDPEFGIAWHNLAETHLQMALQAYLEGRKYITEDDPSFNSIKAKQAKLLELLGTKEDGGS